MFSYIHKPYITKHLVDIILALVLGFLLPFSCYVRLYERDGQTNATINATRTYSITISFLPYNSAMPSISPESKCGRFRGFMLNDPFSKTRGTFVVACA